VADTAAGSLLAADTSSAGPVDSILLERRRGLVVSRRRLAARLDSLGSRATATAVGKERRVAGRERRRSTHLRSRFRRGGCVLLGVGTGSGRRWGWC
jgi:hypothetical protein